jgi:hypothetical protein
VFRDGVSIINMDDKKSFICTWIGDGEGCRHPTMFGKSYCEVHHDRMYTTFLPEMANYIIEKELNSILPIDSTHPPR